MTKGGAGVVVRTKCGDEAESCLRGRKGGEVRGIGDIS
jgi:hypothetical protein